MEAPYLFEELRRQKRSIPLLLFGLYYILTGLWGLISLDSFIAVVWSQDFEYHSRFTMQNISLLFTLLGAYFVFMSRNPSQYVVYFAASCAFFNAVFEILYFHHVRKSLLVYDIFIQLGFSVALLWRKFLKS